MKQGQDPRTTAVRAGVDSDEQHGAVMPPLYLTSNFAFEGFAKKRPHDYTRTSNPTRDLLAEALAALEEGTAGVVTGSGMAAVTLALELVPIGGRVVAPRDCYGGTYRLLRDRAAAGYYRVDFIDQTDMATVSAALDLPTDMLWIETPTNPLLRVVDIEKLAELAKQADALTVVDNTFLSPALQRPLTLGADIVVHSTTKYINGHGDVVGGAAVAADAAVAERLSYTANALGLTGAPFDSFLTLRGLRTLHARLRLHEENAMALAETLHAHPAVSVVHYPGLPSHPQHELAGRQQTGFGGMLSFELAGGREVVGQFVEGLELFSLAESLGGVESLVCHPATMTHVPLSHEARQAAGIVDGLVRLSVGIESTEDLRADLVEALNRI
jgi:cystathionine gamma-synthase